LEDINEFIYDLLSRAEQSRQQELAKALKRIGTLDEKQKKIVNDLTSKLVGKLFQPIIENIQLAITNNQQKTIEIATKLFIPNTN
jgi:glutamyl-tRNA reductase